MDKRNGVLFDKLADGHRISNGRCSVTNRLLSGGLSTGVQILEVDNGVLEFSVIPTRGMGIWKAKLSGLDIGWKSPVRGPVHPSFVRLWEPSGIGWLDGFDELVVRCGLDSNGAFEFTSDGRLKYPLHGRIANIPAYDVTASVDTPSGQISITGVVDEARLFSQKLRLMSAITTSEGQPRLTITDVITNMSAEPADLELLYHINFGAPLLEPGAKVVAPVIKVAPRDKVAVENVPEWDTYGPETPGLQEAVFFFELAADPPGNTEVLLHNARKDTGVSLRFSKAQLPCFTLWKNRQAVQDGYVTGFEPATNFPNVKSFEKKQGRVITLGPGEIQTFGFSMEVHTDAASVERSAAAIAELQKAATPQVLDKPDPQWSKA